MRHGVDTGFLVFNHRTYPRLVELFRALEVPTAPSEMSFSVQVPQQGIEWSGRDLNTVFAQRATCCARASWACWRRSCASTGWPPASPRGRDDAALAEPIGDFLDRHGFGEAFRDWYLLPMLGCIWSCPTDQMLRFPVATMIRFCHNHGLIQISDRPQWHTVRRRLARVRAQDARRRWAMRACAAPCAACGARPAGVLVATDHGSERFDDVVLACHSDQALGAAGRCQRRTSAAVLGAIRYQPNRAVLHTDTALLPRRRLAWAAWNYERAADDARPSSRAVCLHYLINRLQPLPWQHAGGGVAEPQPRSPTPTR